VEEVNSNPFPNTSVFPITGNPVALSFDPTMGAQSDTAKADVTLRAGQACGKMCDEIYFVWFKGDSN
jgi:hypothetical protein